MTLRERLGRMDWRDGVNLGLKLALVLIVIPFVLVAVPQLVGASNSYIVLSNSMNDDPAPVLQTGDVIFVYDTPPPAIESGDVITYQSGEGPVTTHRVVGVTTVDGAAAFRTKGDANEDADAGLVRGGQVIGTVGFYIPWIGRVVAFAGTRNGLIALVIVPSALLVLSELFNIGQLLRGARGDQQLGDGSHQDSGMEEP